MSGENLLKTRHPKIYVGRIATYSAQQIAQIVDELRTAVSQSSESQIRLAFNNYLADATVEMPEPLIEPKAIAADQSFVTKPTTLGLAEK
jgi:hypothetical protein